MLGYLINIRNIIQCFTSVDRRYGPMFNQGLAEVLMAGLLRHGYRPDSRIPVYLIGYSGAGQMAVGPARYLKEWVQAPVYVITIGGVFGSDPSLLVIDHLYRLVGDNDKIERYRMIAPGNWSIFRHIGMESCCASRQDYTHQYGADAPHRRRWLFGCKT